MFERIVLSVLAIFAIATQAEAQNPAAMSLLRKQELQQQQQQQQHQNQQQFNQQQMQPQSVTVTGTLQQISNNLLVVEDDKQQIWQIHDTKDTKVQLTGTAELDFLSTLKKELPVEFEAKLDVQGKGDEEVKSLTVISLTHDKKPGVFSNQASNAKPSKSIQPGHNTVIGYVKTYRDNVLTVRAGTYTVQVTLADSAQIKINLANLSLAAEGDKITVRGLTTPTQNQMQPQRMPNQHQNQNQNQNQNQQNVPKIVQAQDVKVEISETLTSGKKRASSKAAAKPKSSKKDDDSSDEK
jgi:hypothetical protein